MPEPAQRERLSVAILALGGQGGGVLAEWIENLAVASGRLAQRTSVPGVAQRTGSTVYYVELTRAATTRQPIMAQMPVPGDVDIVLASELMETGRAVLRGFSSADRTTLIGSTHRIFAISEKSAMGDGRRSSENILAAARRNSRKFIGFDMDRATRQSNSVVSSVMFGALAGSEAMPFPLEAYENVIRASGIAVDSNLAGFRLGYQAARENSAAAAEPLPAEPALAEPVPTTAAGRRLAERIDTELPHMARRHARIGAQRLMDYQDQAYADLYLDRVGSIARLDQEPHSLTDEVARYLALWMSYEDTVRVADLKVRSSRTTRVHQEIGATPGQLVSITEFMHPRLREVCETLPAAVGRTILRTRWISRFLGRFFQNGRHVRTSRLRWYLLLRALAGMRRFRRSSLRFVEEQNRIDNWLETVKRAVAEDRDIALELVRCQRLIKGYGDTFDRGLTNFEAILADYEKCAPTDRSAARIRRLRTLALGDEDGQAFKAELVA
ncbi:indolepyruvate oxidoreductase subunit beta family protein [Pacificimonas sp. WHA3]|uniref:Indolepyruvate oxidoreductase subunit beta family protein n=1 Tax=Pacificimonas pallii TaxID=2827236 RepID=A0ABS6SHV3_9SPHN|nr:indolepyruvate oxidoreductase subunit beta family protein [Pacificimonas pallii]MBV7257501.1 indolepyruvate oxidoreductase subunit beta family protein [Pacificimonas pallii]